MGDEVWTMVQADYRSENVNDGEIYALESTNYWRLELVFGSGHRTKVSGGRRLVP